MRTTSLFIPYTTLAQAKEGIMVFNAEGINIEFKRDFTNRRMDIAIPLGDEYCVRLSLPTAPPNSFSMSDDGVKAVRRQYYREALESLHGGIAKQLAILTLEDVK